MKSLFALSALALSFQASAAGISFTYFGNEAGRQSYYACSYVEDQAESYLELLGATNIDVRCMGGIQPGWMTMPVSVQASFDLPVVTGSHVETLEIEGDVWNPACGLNVRLMSEILNQFKNITVIKKRDACPFADSNYYYQLQINR
jgi:hypothetical protein